MASPDKEVVIGFVTQKNKKTSAAMFEAYLNLAAITFVSEKDVIIGKIRIDTNDYPDIFKPEPENHGLFFVPSYDKKNPVQYTGVYEFKEMEDFVKINLKKSREHLKRNPVKEESKEKPKQETKAKATNDKKVVKETKAKVAEEKKPEVTESKAEVTEKAKHEETCDEELCTEPHEPRTDEKINKLDEKTEL